MQKITFNRDHLEYKKGETIEVDEARAAYFENVGVASKAKAKEAVKEAPKEEVKAPAKKSK